MENYSLSISSSFEGLLSDFVSHTKDIEPLFEAFAKAFNLELNVYYKQLGTYFNSTDEIKEETSHYRAVAVYNLKTDKKTANRVRKALFYFMLVNHFKEEENVKYTFS